MAGIVVVSAEEIYPEKKSGFIVDTEGINTSLSCMGVGKARHVDAPRGARKTACSLPIL